MAYTRANTNIQPKDVRMVEAPDIWGIDTHAIDIGQVFTVVDRDTKEIRRTAPMVEYERFGTNIYAMDEHGHVYTNSDHYKELFEAKIKYQQKQQEPQEMTTADIVDIVNTTGKAPFRMTGCDTSTLMIERGNEFEPISLSDALQAVQDSRNLPYNPPVTLAMSYSMVDLSTNTAHQQALYRLDNILSMSIDMDGHLTIDCDNFVLTSKPIEKEYGMTAKDIARIESNGAFIENPGLAAAIAGKYLDGGKTIYSMTDFDLYKFATVDRDTQLVTAMRDLSQIEVGKGMLLGGCEVVNVENQAQAGSINGKINTVTDVLYTEDQTQFAIVSRSAIFTNLNVDEMQQALTNEREDIKFYEKALDAATAIDSQDLSQTFTGYDNGPIIS